MYTVRDNEPENWHWINSVLCVLLENTTESLYDKNDEVYIKTAYSVGISTLKQIGLF